MEVYDSNKNNYDDNDNYNDNYNDLTEMAMMMALTRFPPPSHMSSYVGTCSTARASLTPTTAPAPYTYPYPKSSIWLQSKKSQPIEIFPPKYVLLC